MILFNTTFNVSKSFTRVEFLDIVKKYLISEQFSDINFGDILSLDEARQEFSGVKGDDSLHAVLERYGDIFILSYTVRNEQAGHTYQSEYVFNDSDEKHLLHFYQEKTFDKIVVSDEEEQGSVPDFLNFIFWNEYGGNDDCLLTTDEPFIIRKSDIDTAKTVIQNTSNFTNPIVYVSPFSESGGYALDCDKLAKDLCGQAHVLVEKSPIISSEVAAVTNGQNPYNGNVKIYIANSDAVSLLSQSNFNETIVNTVRNMMSHISVPDDLNSAKIRQAYMLNRISGGDEELLKLCESMIFEKDQRILQLESELSNVKQALRTKSAKADALEDSMIKTDPDGKEFVKLEVTEKDLYAQEISSVVLKCLQKEYDVMKDDSNLNTSRKFHILSDILDHNFPCATDAELIRCIRGAFDDGVLSKDGIGCLRSSGFTVETQGKRNPHYKICLRGDERYVMTLASTPSDNRGYKNAISDFITMLFGH